MTKYCYIVLKSSTIARRAEILLTRHSFDASVARLPMSLSAVGCGYAVKLQADILRQAVDLLLANSFFPTKIYCRESGNAYYEVEM